MPQVIVSFTSSSWILELLSAIADENYGGCEVSQCLVILTNMSAGNLSIKTLIKKQAKQNKNLITSELLMKFCCK